MVHKIFEVLLCIGNQTHILLLLLHFTRYELEKVQFSVFQKCSISLVQASFVHIYVCSSVHSLGRIEVGFCSGLIRMDSYFYLAVYMIYYLSVHLWSIEYFVCLQKKNTRRRQLSQAFSLINFCFADRNYSPGKIQHSW